MNAKSFWTITELAAELGGHHNGVRNWCHKLGLGTMTGSLYIIDAEERKQLAWVYSLEHHQRIMLSAGTLSVYCPEVWATKPAGLELRRKETT